MNNTMTMLVASILALMFLNGCAILRDPAFIRALNRHNCRKGYTCCSGCAGAEVTKCRTN